MTKILPGVLLLAFSLHLPAQSIRRIDGTRIDAVKADTLARRLIAQEHVTGGQIAVLNDGRLVWSAAYGLRDVEHNLPMQTSTTTWAASITKSVFATYVMQLSLAGKLPLDTPIAQLLPQPLTSYPEYKDSAADLVNDPRYATITPRMLLAHSAGFANFAAYEPDKKMHLHFAPGTRFAYSGEGLNLLQFVIEQREHALGMARAHEPGGEGGGGRGVALGGFRDDLIGLEKGQGGARAGELRLVGQDENVLARHDAVEPAHRILDQGTIGEKLEQVLGRAPPAHRPETFAAAARHDTDEGVGIHVEVHGRPLFATVRGGAKL